MNKFSRFISGFIILAIILAATYIITCGIVALVALCFGFEPTWGIGTGVYIILATRYLMIKLDKFINDDEEER